MKNVKNMYRGRTFEGALFLLGLGSFGRSDFVAILEIKHIFSAYIGLLTHENMYNQ